MHEKRKKVWIDRFQTLLFWRIGLYFFFYQLGVWFLVVLERHISTTLGQVIGNDNAAFFMFILIGIVIYVGALFTYDAVKFAHRLVGPLVPFRKTMQAIRDGEEVGLVQLRKDDLLHDMKDEFNEMLQALEQRGAIVLKTPQEQQAETTAKK